MGTRVSSGLLLLACPPFFSVSFWVFWLMQLLPWYSLILLLIYRVMVCGSEMLSSSRIFCSNICISSSIASCRVSPMWWLRAFKNFFEFWTVYGSVTDLNCWGFSSWRYSLMARSLRSKLFYSVRFWSSKIGTFCTVSSIKLIKLPSSFNNW